MEFLAEVKKATQIKKVSLDNEYQILLITNDPNALDLGKLPADALVRVTVKVDEAH